MEHIPGEGKRVALMDYGAKNSILRSCAAEAVTFMYFLIIPLRKRCLPFQPDGIMLSNGPGDPEECVESIACVRKATIAACRSSASAWVTRSRRWPWARTVKMDYGHHGVNHPVKACQKPAASKSPARTTNAVDGRTALPARRLRRRTSTCSTERLRAWRARRSGCSACSSIPRQAPGPVDTNFLFDRFYPP